jgi:hypothetical protein
MLDVIMLNVTAPHFELFINSKNFGLAGMACTLAVLLIQGVLTVGTV